MSSNPYSPPKAPVADAQPDTAAVQQQPTAVSTAVSMLWLALVVSIISSALRIKGATHQDAVNYGLWLLIANAAMSIWLNLKIAAGRNWARIVWMVWFLLGAAATVALFLTILKQYEWNTLARFQGLLQTTAFVLLLTPSAARWFKRPRKSDTGVTLRT
jgi:hypothetical protein